MHVIAILSHPLSLLRTRRREKHPHLHLQIAERDMAVTWPHPKGHEVAHCRLATGHGSATANGGSGADAADSNAARAGNWIGPNAGCRRSGASTLGGKQQQPPGGGAGLGRPRWTCGCVYSAGGKGHHRITGLRPWLRGAASRGSFNKRG